MQKHLLFLAVLLAVALGAVVKLKSGVASDPPAPIKPVPPPAPVRKDAVPEFTPYPAKFAWETGKDFYADVLNHRAARPKKYDDRNTDAHENCHLVEGEIHNWAVAAAKNGRRLEAFYVGADRAVVIPVPNFKILETSDYVPMKFRGGRYRLYMNQQPVNQPILNDDPLYIWNEWNCYINGAIVSVEDAEAGVEQTKSDAVLGAVEFVGYALTIGMYCEYKDPEYFAANPQFKNFLAWNIRRTYAAYKRAVKFPQHRWDSPIPGEMRSGPEGKRYREFMKNTLEMDLEELFGES